MVEEHTEESKAVNGSDPVLRNDGDTKAVPVGEDSLLSDMRELEQLFREFGQRCSHYEAQKALFRCVDILRMFNNEHR